MSSTSNTANVRGDNNSGTWIAQSHGPVSIIQHATPEAGGQHSQENACLQLFRLSKAGGGGSYEWYMKRIEERVTGTCQWFLSHPNYLSWKQSSHGPLLVSADPGCGKSVLAKHLIEHELSGTICYFFFKDHDQNTTRQALCALLHQLFVQRRSLLKHAIAKYNDNGPELLNNENLLWDIFSSAVGDPEAGAVTVVLDALDECKLSDLKDLSVWFRKLLNGASEETVGPKVFFTTRPYQAMLSEFWELAEDFANIRIPGEEHSEQIGQEVNCVIKHRVQQLAKKFRLKNELSGYLERRLLDMTHRTYLWTHLVFDHLNNGFKKTEKAIKETIDTLPATVNEAYESILEKSTDKEKAQKTLSIILAALQPLTIQEMNVAVHVLSASHARSLEDLDLEDDEDFKYTIRDWCGLFISIYDNHVYLIHQTAREFLQAPFPCVLSPPDGRQWRGSLYSSKAHAILAECCLRCVDFFTFDTNKMITRLDIVKEHRISLEDYDFGTIPFFRYAARDWPVHFREAMGGPDPELISLAVQACTLEESLTPAWVYVYCLDWGITEPADLDTDFSSLHIACATGLEIVAERLVTDANLDHADATGRTPLFYAILNDMRSLTRHLVEKGANILHRARFQRTTLHYAIRASRTELATYLIDRGVPVDAADELGATALHHAARESRRSIECLIEAGASLTARDAFGSTPLHTAAEIGLVEEMSPLFDADRSTLNLQDNDGCTPLHLAAHAGHLDAARWLIRCGAGLETRNKLGATPLGSAVVGRSLGVVEFLLEAGANVHTTDIVGDGVLRDAAFSSSSLLLATLIRHGARATSALISRLESLGLDHLDSYRIQLLRSAISPSAESTEQDGTTAATDKE